MAYPTGLEKTRAGTVSAHPGYVCRLGENGRKRSNGKTTEMSADSHAVVVWGECPATGSLTRFIACELIVLRVKDANFRTLSNRRRYTGVFAP